MLLPSYSTTTANKLLNSQPIFNGPFKRAELRILPQYAASDGFLAAGKWAGERNYVLSLQTDDDGDTTEPLFCIVVGVISAEKVYLGRHGNCNTTYNENASKAKMLQMPKFSFPSFVRVIHILVQISTRPLWRLKSTSAKLPKHPTIAASFCRGSATQCV